MTPHFEETGLREDLCQQAQQKGFLTPTPIQKTAIPIILAGHDLIATAPTGTGKTAAYALPLIQKLQDTSHSLLVLQPTRDLVLQTTKVFENFTPIPKKNTLKKQIYPLSIVPILGGIHKSDQAKTLIQYDTKNTIIIATPGRLLDLLTEYPSSLEQCRFFVLDEGDRLLSDEFLQETMAIMEYLPKPRQTLLFSATRLPQQQPLLRRVLHKPKEITITLSATISQNELSQTGTPKKEKRKILRHAALFIENTEKLPFLKNLLIQSQRLRRIIFVRTKSDADLLARDLQKAGLAVAPLHADLPQQKRTSTIACFASGRIYTLVATDIAARGLDFHAVTEVINYDVPERPDNYLHRVGRAGRGEQKGSALTLCTHNERPFLRRIEKETMIKLRILTTNHF